MARPLLSLWRQRARFLAHGPAAPPLRPAMSTLSVAGSVATPARPQRAARAKRPPTSTDDLYRGVVGRDRALLARAITLVESSKPAAAAEAEGLLSRVLQHNAERQSRADGQGLDVESGQFAPPFRIGISGPPGAGKSTFIESFGNFVISQGHRLAVLAVDPSSSVSGGSILGDKTRMPTLTHHPDAYIRPSPSSGSLGGVSRNTANAVVLCEGAGHDVVLVETVGVGQSETAVADMVDMFVLLVPPAGGDELQGIKRGIVELADLVLVNKADGDLLRQARLTSSEYTSAIKLLRPKHPTSAWRSKVMRVSAIEEDGIPEAWETMQAFRQEMIGSGILAQTRSQQYKKWMWAFITERMMSTFRASEAVQRDIHLAEQQVGAQLVAPSTAADRLLRSFYQSQAQQR